MLANVRENVCKNICFGENLRENICFPEAFCNNMCKTGANARGSLIKCAVFCKKMIFFAKEII
jgi:hypothetical protein